MAKQVRPRGVRGLRRAAWGYDSGGSAPAARAQTQYPAPEMGSPANLTGQVTPSAGAPSGAKAVAQYRVKQAAGPLAGGNAFKAATRRIGGPVGSALGALQKAAG